MANAPQQPTTATALARTDDNFFSEETLKLIRSSLVPGASDDEFKMLIEVARIRRLNPLLKQIHFVKRKSKDEDGNWSDRWAFQVSIDGFRLIAERTGFYDGQDEPEFEIAPDGVSLVRCKVKIHRTDKTRPFVGIADWTEFVQKSSGGDITKMWREKPRLMLAKCAEAMAFRKAFPEETSAFYIEEEIGRAAREDEMQGEVVPTMGKSVAKARPGAKSIVEMAMLVSADQSKASARALQDLLKGADTRDAVVKIGAKIDEAATEGTLHIADRAECLRDYTEALRRIAKPRTPPATPPAQGGAA